MLGHTQKDSHDLPVRKYFVYVGSSVPTVVTTPKKLIADIRGKKATGKNI